MSDTNNDIKMATGCFMFIASLKNSLKLSGSITFSYLNNDLYLRFGQKQLSILYTPFKRCSQYKRAPIKSPKLLKSLCNQCEIFNKWGSTFLIAKITQSSLYIKMKAYTPNYFIKKSVDSPRNATYYYDNSPTSSRNALFFKQQKCNLSHNLISTPTPL